MALSAIFTLLVAVLPVVGEVMRTCGGVVSVVATVTCTVADVPTFPEASNALAWSPCEPEAARDVSHANENGVAVSVASSAPSM